MTLWRLGGANVAPLRIVEFSGRNEFARLLYRRTESPQVADTTQERQPIHHLTDARLRSHLSRLEIARGERRFHAHVHNRRLEHLVHIGRIDNILKLARRLPGSVVNLLHNRRLHILDDLGAEIEAEQIAQQIAREFHLLVGISVTIVVGDLVVIHIQYLLGHRT